MVCTLTSAMLFNEGAAINTTYGVNSDVRKIFNACGSTSKMAIFPSLWMRRIVSNLVPYIASSWVPVKYIHEYYYKYNGMISLAHTRRGRTSEFCCWGAIYRIATHQPLDRQRFASTKETQNIKWDKIERARDREKKERKCYLPYSKYSLAAMSAIISSCDTK